MKRRVYTINGKIPVEASATDTILDNEISVNSITNYYSVSLSKLSETSYATTFSCTEDVEIVTKEEGLHYYTFVKNSEGDAAQIPVEEVVPAYTGVVILSDHNTPIMFKSTKKKVTKGIVTNTVGFSKDMTYKEIVAEYLGSTPYILVNHSGEAGWGRMADDDSDPLAKGKAVLLTF